MTSKSREKQSAATIFGVQRPSPSCSELCTAYNTVLSLLTFSPLSCPLQLSINRSYSSSLQPALNRQFLKFLLLPSPFRFYCILDRICCGSFKFQQKLLFFYIFFLWKCPFCSSATYFPVLDCDGSVAPINVTDLLQRMVRKGWLFEE